MLKTHIIQNKIGAGSHCLLVCFVLIFNTLQAQDTLLVLPEVPILREAKVSAAGFVAQRLDSSVMGDHARHSLAELLGYRSQLYIKSYGIGGLATASFRGTGANHTRVYYKTLPLNSALLGLTDLALLPVIVSDAVDIYHGAAGLALGAGGMGGSINLNTTVQSEPGQDLTIGYSAGSFDTQHGYGAIRFTKAKWHVVQKLFWKTAQNDFLYQNTEKPGHPTERLSNAETRQQGLMSECYYTIKPGHRLGAGLWLQSGQRNIPPLLFTSNTDESQQDASLRSFAEYLYAGERVQMTLISGYFAEELSYYHPRSNYIAVTQSRAVKNRFNATGKAGKLTEWNLGALHEYDRVSADGLPNTASRMLYSPTAGLSSHTQNKKWESSLRLRQEWYDHSASPLLGNWGLVFKPSMQSAWQIRSGVSRDYRLPALADLYRQPGGKPDLLPELQHAAELGADYNRTNKTQKTVYQTSLTLSRAEAENLILWRPVSAGLWSPENLSRVSIYSIELFASARTQSGPWQLAGELTGNYTHSVNKDRILLNDNVSNKHVIYVPLWQAKGHLELRHQQGYRITWRRYATGRRYIATDNSEYLPFFVADDVVVGKSFKKIKNLKEFELKLEALNLLNVNYQNIAYRPMPGRHFMVGLLCRI